MARTTSRSEGRMSAVTALSGAALFFVGTLLHPSMADPNNFPAAFAEYTAFGPWVAVHLTQLAGVWLIMAALVLLARKLAGGPGAPWAMLAQTGAMATIALYAGLAAVDGVALKAMVRLWAAAQEPGQTALFQAAVAVRQIEIGLSSVNDMLVGLTASLYGMALLVDGRASRWIGALALVGGIPTVVAGVVIAYTGFSDLELTIGMVADPLLLLWIILLGIAAWRGAAFWQPAAAWGGEPAA